MKKISKKTITFIVGGILLILALFTLWWYGVFSDIGKSGEKISFNELAEKAEEESLELLPPIVGEWENEERDQLFLQLVEKRLSKMTTKALVETYLSGSRKDSDIFVTDPDEVYFSMIQLGLSTDGYYLKELSDRENAARVLAQRYLDTPFLYTTDHGDVQTNLHDLILMEAILSQPEYRRHLPPWLSVQKLIEKKQAEKFSVIGTELEEEYYKTVERQTKDPDYWEGNEHHLLEVSRYNLLYTDAYDENGWNEERLNEYASKYIDLAEWGLTE